MRHTKNKMCLCRNDMRRTKNKMRHTKIKMCLCRNDMRRTKNDMRRANNDKFLTFNKSAVLERICAELKIIATNLILVLIGKINKAAS
jgi:hypothetical protein